MQSVMLTKTNLLSTLAQRSCLRTISPSYSVRQFTISIPAEKLDYNFSRSAGPGGQNVNKVNTKAEIRFHVMSAEWYVTLIQMIYDIFRVISVI